MMLHVFSKDDPGENITSYFGCKYIKEEGFSLSLFFLIIFPQSSRVHITRAVLEQFLSFAKYLDGLSHGAPLLKQLCDHILFNPAIWIHTPAKVIVHLSDVTALLQRSEILVFFYTMVLRFLIFLF